MGFERARTDEHKQIRINQIINATLKLYEDIPYKKITLARISKELDFSRANLYKYVSSKEEIFLKVIERDFKAWMDDFKICMDKEDDLSIEEFAKYWTQTLYSHKRLIELLSILYTIIEKNVTIDNLAEFKISLFKILSEINEIIKDQFPNMTMENIITFLDMQMYFAIGLYPATRENEVQIKAIKKAGIPYKTPEFIDTFSKFIIMTINELLKD